MKYNPCYITGYESLHCGGLGSYELFRMCNDSVAVQNKGSIPDIDFTTSVRSRLNDKDQNKLPLLWTLLLIERAMETAKWTNLDNARIIIGTTTGLMSYWETNLIKYFQSHNPQNSNIYKPIDEFREKLCEALKFDNKALCVSSACAASTQALGIAKTWINQGLEKCLVIGVEQHCITTNTGFKSLSLSKEEPSKPFNKSTNGIFLSEAAAVICLESKTSSEPIEITGYGCSSDAHSMTSPDPSGLGPKNSMKQALLSSQLTAHQIQWVHAHGTGSFKNDEAESLAICEIFGDIYTSSTKATHGHALGASGALETTLCCEALKAQQIPPSLFAIMGDYPINTSEQPTKLKLKNINKNTLGFGGVNTSLIISHKDYQ